MTTVDLDRLFKLRLVVARHGEMDLAKWWNSNGMLGSRGAVVLERGFPRTHFFAQARAVFAIAQARCAKVYDPLGCMTLWHLPAELKDGWISTLRSARHLSTTNRVPLPGAPALTRAGLSPAGLVQSPRCDMAGV